MCTVRNVLRIRAALSALLFVLPGLARAAYVETHLAIPVLPGSSYCTPVPRVGGLDVHGRVSGTAVCYICQGSGCSGFNSAVLWDGGQATTVVDFPNQGTEATSLASPADDPTTFFVAGALSLAPGNTSPFLTSDDGTAVLPLPPGTSEGAAFAVNAAGVAVGAVRVDGYARPTQWRAGGIDAIPLLGFAANGLGIDDAGQVLVQDIDEPLEQCEGLRLWSASENHVLVPMQCGFDADAAFISPGGVIVATVDDRPVRIFHDGTVDLGALPAGWTPIGLTDVNDYGIAVGTAYAPVTSPVGAFVARSVAYLGGQAIDASDFLPAQFANGRLEAINARGQLVVAQGAGSPEGAFLLTPICGDGPDLGQLCDDGDADDRDGCKNDCTPNVCGDGTVRDGIESCDDGNQVAADGCEPGCTLTPESVNAVVSPGGALGTNAGDGGVASPSNPIATTVTSPTGGSVSISETGDIGAPPAGYALLGSVIDVTAPPSSAGDPLRIEFRLDASIVPAGTTAATLAVFRNGVAVTDCPMGLGGGADPSPCVGLRETLADGDAHLVVLTTHASQWAVGVPTTCGNGVLDPDEQCDDGNRAPGDCCGSDCAFEPLGTTCRPVHASCDVAETCTGLSGVCPADAAMPDGDQDERCDGIDPCTNGSTLVGGKLTLSKLGAPLGDEVVSVKGQAPPPSTLDPVRRGVRLHLTDAAGATLVDVDVPAGAYDTETKRGWKAAPAGTKWSYKGRAPGITKVSLKIVRGTLAVRLGGKGLSVTPPGTLPVTAAIVLTPPRGSGAACTESSFVSCKAAGSKVSCKS